MFDWLLRKFRRQSRPAIRTIDDLTAAIKAGKIKPHIYRDGDVQVADLFAETGLSDEERTKVMLRSFATPAGIRMFVHCHCAEQFLAGVPPDQTPYAPSTEQWTPADLIGRFRDITCCDECGKGFLPSDEGYTAYWIVSREELRLLEEVQRENSGPHDREGAKDAKETRRKNQGSHRGTEGTEAKLQGSEPLSANGDFRFEI